MPLFSLNHTRLDPPQQCSQDRYRCPALLHICCYMISGILLLQVIGPEWKDALQHLTALTCVWTITRKTGLRVKNVQQLPDFLSMAAVVREHNEIWVYVDCSMQA